MSTKMLLPVLVVSLMVGGISPAGAKGSQTARSIANGLSQMPLDEKQNAIIELILEKDASDQALIVAAEISKRWNEGEFDTALELFDQLALLTDLEQTMVSGIWRTPVPTVQPDRFGTDTPIAYRDSILAVELEVHRTSGNLVAVVVWEGDGAVSMMGTVLSFDGGAIWYEISFVSSNVAFQSVSAAMLNDHCYVAYKQAPRSTSGATAMTPDTWNS